jgi:hypothetical protein
MWYHVSNESHGNWKVLEKKNIQDEKYIGSAMGSQLFEISKAKKTKEYKAKKGLTMR